MTSIDFLKFPTIEEMLAPYLTDPCARSWLMNPYDPQVFPIDFSLFPLAFSHGRPKSEDHIKCDNIVIPVNIGSKFTLILNMGPVPVHAPLVDPATGNAMKILSRMNVLRYNSDRFFGNPEAAEFTHYQNGMVGVAFAMTDDQDMARIYSWLFQKANDSHIDFEKPLSMLMDVELRCCKYCISTANSYVCPHDPESRGLDRLKPPRPRKINCFTECIRYFIYRASEAYGDNVCSVLHQVLADKTCIPINVVAVNRWNYSKVNAWDYVLNKYFKDFLPVNPDPVRDCILSYIYQILLKDIEDSQGKDTKESKNISPCRFDDLQYDQPLPTADEINNSDNDLKFFRELKLLSLEKNLRVTLVDDVCKDESEKDKNSNTYNNNNDRSNHNSSSNSNNYANMTNSLTESKRSRITLQDHPRDRERVLSSAINKAIQCHYCGIKMARKGNMRRHIESMHEQSSSLFPCDLCEAKFKTEKQVHYHKLQQHLEGKIYACKLCDRSFVRDCNLKEHVRSFHEKTQMYQCSICAKTFGKKFNFLRHTKTHETVELLNGDERKGDTNK